MVEQAAKQERKTRLAHFSSVPASHITQLLIDGWPEIAVSGCRNATGFHDRKSRTNFRMR